LIRRPIAGRTEVEHVGSAHTDAELAALWRAAQERLHAGQGVLDVGDVLEAPPRMSDIADWTKARDAVVGASPNDLAPGDRAAHPQFRTETLDNLYTLESWEAGRETRTRDE
jgi:hypothetical protein